MKLLWKLNQLWKQGNESFGNLLKTTVCELNSKFRSQSGKPVVLKLGRNIRSPVGLCQKEKENTHTHTFSGYIPLLL